MRQFYCGDRSTLDLSKMIEQAELIAKGDYRNKPETVVLHMHKFEEPCLKTFEHKTYEAQVQGE